MADIALQDKLRAILRDRTGSDTAHDLGHMDRVWRNAAWIADQPETAKTNTKVLIGACYLHDLIALPKDAPHRADASRLSADEAEPILTDLGFTTEEITATQHAIIAHSFSARVPPETIEAQVVQDADRIESLGAIGLARIFAVSGSLGRPLFDSDDPFAKHRPLDDTTFAIDHFKQKLLSLPESMQTSAGRRLADKRAQVLRGYLETLAAELQVLPPDW